jgi:propionyl-CoA synthetase
LQARKIVLFKDFHETSIAQPRRFWLEHLELISWRRPPTSALEGRLPHSPRWFPNGIANLCFNAVDRHLPEIAKQAALICVSSETNAESILTYGELHRDVQRFAAALISMSVGKGDRVVSYMPMIAETVVAMLGCVRIGAIHSVVFGGFAAGLWRPECWMSNRRRL